MVFNESPEIAPFSWLLNMIYLVISYNAVTKLSKYKSLKKKKHFHKPLNRALLLKDVTLYLSLKISPTIYKSSSRLKRITWYNLIWMELVETPYAASQMKWWGMLQGRSFQWYWNAPLSSIQSSPLASSGWPGLQSAYVSGWSDLTHLNTPSISMSFPPSQ